MPKASIVEAVFNTVPMSTVDFESLPREGEAILYNNIPYIVIKIVHLITQEHNSSTIVYLEPK